MDLVDRVAVVSGAGQGIGKAIALKLASRGAAVVVLDLNGETAAQTVEEIRSMGRRALCLQLDVNLLDDLRSAIEGVIKEMGAIDILVACAGTGQAKNIFSITEQEWDVMLDLNLKSTFFINQMVLKHMCDRGRGVVVNMASIAGRKGRDFNAHYAVSKAGVISLTQSFALAVGRYGVRVNAVCPGVVPTAMWTKLGTEIAGGDASRADEMRNERARLAVLPTDESTEDVAELTAFLVSDQSKYITGQSINVDGGIEMN